MKRKLKVTIIKIQRRITPNQSFGAKVFCEICQEFGEILSLAGTKEVLEWLMATKKVHFNLTPNGGLQICKNSLLQNDKQKEFKMFLSMRH